MGLELAKVTTIYNQAIRTAERFVSTPAASNTLPVKASHFERQLALLPAKLDRVTLSPILPNQISAATLSNVRNYHSGKVAAAIKHSRTTEFLNNWKDSYGIAGQKGIYENAINVLSKKDGAIEQYLAASFKNINSRTKSEAKQLLQGYLKSHLDIYSYDRMKGILKEFAQQIKKTGLNSGADTVVYIPDANKSYGVVSGLYKEVCPEARFVTGWGNLKKHLADASQQGRKTNVAILDDCMVSGNSAANLYDSIVKGAPQVNRVDLYVCAAYEKGIKNVSEKAPALNLHFDGKAKQTLEDSDFYKNLLITVGGKPKTVKQDFLRTLLRCQDPTQGYSEGTALMFPYMSPNNNSIFSANMVADLFSGPKFAIKNIEKSIETKEGKLNYPPVWLESLLG